MTTRKKLTLAAAATATALALAGAALVQANGDDGERQATGPQAAQAKAAALKVTDGGRVNAVERDGEQGATWEVEITRPDGRTVDVRLDERFGLVVVDGDGEDEGSE